MSEIQTGSPSQSGQGDSLPDTSLTHRLRRIQKIALNPRFAGLWVLGLVILVFGVLRPSTFLTLLSLETTLKNVAVVAFLALGMTFGFVAGVLDFSVAWVAGFSLVFVSYLTMHGIDSSLAAVITLAVTTLFGALSAFMVAKLKVLSIVATLGVGTVALALTELIANGMVMTPDLDSAFSYIGRGDVLHVPISFLIVLVVAAAMHYVFEHTPIGRRIRAAGVNPVAARLAGIRVVRMQVGVLLVSAFMSGCGGLILLGQTGAATDAMASVFLLPAAAGIFLGATQFKRGANPWGTLLAVVLLAAGAKGLQLMGAERWVSNLFNGGVLLIAVGIGGRGGGKIM